MLGSFVTWITGAFDKGADVGLRPVPVGHPDGMMARGAGVRTWSWTVTDLAGEPMREWMGKTERARGAPPSDATLGGASR